MTHAESGLTVTAALTPNPSTARFAINRPLVSGRGRDYPDRESQEGSPLAQRLFAHPDVTAVYIGEGFVTITVCPGDGPLALAEFVKDALEAHVASGEPAVAPSADADDDGDPDGEADGEGGELGQRIAALLDLKVRPAVAMDGGDIAFAGLENGVVFVHMRGACHGCPSSVMTLRMGVEALLKEEFPGEVVAVEALP